MDMKEDVLVSSLAKKTAVLAKRKAAPEDQDTLRWRLEHLESQMQKLSQLVRDHAEDVDRQQLLRKHHQQVRVRKHLRASDSKPADY